MVLNISKNAKELGEASAIKIAEVINKAIYENGYARIVLSTGASQFDMLDVLANLEVEWPKVEMFHLDEYIGIDDKHPASFRKYLRERFVLKVNLLKYHFVSGEGDVQANIRELNEAILEKPVDVAVIGIGENAHIAFNDPPADLNTQQPYIVVTLNETCKKQQVGEGWFKTLDDVPKLAISMSCHRIMMSKCIVSVVPHECKANAVYNALTAPLSSEVPATILRYHPDWTLFLDENSASKI